MYKDKRSRARKDERERAQVMMGEVVGEGFGGLGGLEGVRHRLHGELIASQVSLFIEVAYSMCSRQPYTHL